MLSGVVLLLAAFGCTGTTKTHNRLHYLKVDKKLLYTIKANAALTGIAEYYQPPGSEQVYFLNADSRTLFRLDLTDGTIHLQAILAGLPFFNGYTVDERRREITVYTDDSVAVYKTNGTYDHSFSINHIAKDGYLVAANRLFLPVRKKDVYYIHYFPATPGSYKNPTFFHGPVEASWNTKTGALKLLPQSYPANFRTHCYGYNYLADRIEIDDHTHGYTFPYNDSLFVLNLRTGKQESHFFGSRDSHVFEHLNYNDLPTLNESVFDELVGANPYYMMSRRFALAGYYTRMLMKRNASNPSQLDQYMVVFDAQFGYLGETKPPFNPCILLDSKKGLLSVSYDLVKHVLTIHRLSW